MSWQPPSAPPSGGYAPYPGGYAPPPGGYYAPPPGYPAYPGPYGTPGPGPGLVYSGFWRRFGGYLIDGVVIAVPVVVALFVIFGSTLNTYFNQVSSSEQAGTVAPQLVLPSSGLVPYLIFDCALAVLYFGVLVSAWGSTLGQRAVGVRVVCQEDTTKNLPIGRALLRAVVWWGPALVSFVSGVSTIVELAVFLALLWVAWDPRKQGLHDKLGRALVVRPGLPALAAYGQPVYPYAAPGYPAAPPQYPAVTPQYPTAPPQYPPQSPYPSPFPSPSPSQYPPTPPAVP